MLDAAEAAVLASGVVGPIAGVESVQGFVGNQTFRLSTEAGETVYLKSGDTVEAEAGACTLARSVGVPAPEILAVTATYLICAEVTGVPSASDAVVTSAGHALRRLHTIRGTDIPWPDRLLHSVDHLDALAGIIPADLARRLRTTIPAFAETVADVEPVLLHGDLHPRHLHAVGDQLTGILDWGDTMYGDPLFDLARFSMTGPAATRTLLTAYGLEPTPTTHHLFSMYRTLWSLIALHAEHKAGGTWFAPHLQTIRTELAPN
ncbi:phosphotransferase family protein [Kribbella swartbergensis]